MSDEDNMQASENEATAEETAAESQTVEQTDDSNDSQKTSGESTESAQTSEVKEDNKTAPQNQDAKIDSKPVSRRSAAYRIQQLANENKILKQQQQKPEQTDEWEEPAEDEPQPDIAALIAKEVEKRLNPVISESTKNADDGEISELFSGEKAEERSKYENSIREMWKLPQYKDVAAQDLYKIAKFDELSSSMDSVKQQAIEEYKAAQKEAKESSASGTSNTSNRTGKTEKSIVDMTDAELLDHNERVKAGLA